MKTNLRWSNTTFLILAFFSLACCDEAIDPALSTGSYFPSTPGSYWKYVLKQNCDYPLKGQICESTQFSATRPDLYEGTNNVFLTDYVPFASSPTTMQFLKVNGSEYFAAGWYMSEYKFLDVDLPVNSSWKDGPFDEVTYTITEIGVKKKVNGKVYKDVIVVTMRDTKEYPDPIYNASIIEEHYYARNVGEIYMRKTYEREGLLDVWEYTLVDHYLAPEQ